MKLRILQRLGQPPRVMTEAGEEIKGVQRIEYVADAQNLLGEVRLTLSPVAVDLVAEPAKPVGAAGKARPGSPMVGSSNPPASA